MGGVEVQIHAFFDHGIRWRWVVSFRVIQSRRLICAGHVARIGEMRSAYSIFVGKREGR
jgi:hypothetical protein